MSCSMNLRREDLRNIILEIGEIVNDKVHLQQIFVKKVVWTIYEAEFINDLKNSIQHSG